MRAVVLKETKVEPGKELVLKGEAHHHLKVARCRAGEHILLFPGEGLIARAHTLQVGKNETRVEVHSLEQKQRLYEIEICVGLVKKDAMEEVAKISTELGVKEITPLLTRYSQRLSNQFKRWDKIVEQAQQQSNNPYAPVLKETIEFDDLLKNPQKPTGRNFLFSSLPGDIELGLTDPSKLSTRLFIGPEGGFTESEEVALLGQLDTTRVHLPTPILRAPTAISVGVGHVLSSLKFI